MSTEEKVVVRSHSEVIPHEPILNAFHEQLQHVAKDSPTASTLVTNHDYNLAPAAGLPRKHLAVLDEILARDVDRQAASPVGATGSEDERQEAIIRNAIYGLPSV